MADVPNTRYGASDRPALEAAVSADDVQSALAALLASEPSLSDELDHLFLGEDALYEAGSLFRYLFVFPGAPADRADSPFVAFRSRNMEERRSVLAAPDRYGLVRRHDRASQVRLADSFPRNTATSQRKPERPSATGMVAGMEYDVTDAMLIAGRLALADFAPSRDDPEVAVWAIYQAMERAREEPVAQVRHSPR